MVKVQKKAIDVIYKKRCIIEPRESSEGSHLQITAAEAQETLQDGEMSTVSTSSVDKSKNLLQASCNYNIIMVPITTIQISKRHFRAGMMS